MIRTGSILIVTLLLFSACSMTPKLTIKTPQTPKENNSTLTIDSTWYKAFNSTILNQLIDDMLLNNNDLKLAANNLALAKTQLGLSQSALMPNIGLQASSNTFQTSGERLNPFTGQSLNRPGVQVGTFNLSMLASYEIDLWGKLSSMRQSAWAQLLASKAQKESLKIALISSTIELYINALSIQKQLEIAQQMLATQHAYHDYISKQNRHQTIDTLTFHQSRAQLAQSKLALSTLKQLKKQSLAALSHLVGYAPYKLFDEALTLDEALPKPIKIDAHLPSDLITRRPDVTAARQNLIASNALIGAAKAAYFPSFSLTGALGLESYDLRTLLSSNAAVWEFSPTIGLPLADFGRTAHALKEAKLQKNSAVIAYDKSVKTAFKEVFEALNAWHSTQEQVVASQEILQAHNAMQTVAHQRFTQGLIDEPSYLQNRLMALSTKQAHTKLLAQRIIEQVNLYKALGGGWQEDLD